MGRVEPENESLSGERPGPGPDIVQSIVDRIVEVARPVRVLLFGSRSRGDARPDSDLDFLVVVPSGVHRRQVAQDIYQRLVGIKTPVDVVVVTEEDVKRYADTSSLVIEPAMREGEIVYEAVPAGRSSRVAEEGAK